MSDPDRLENPAAAALKAALAAKRKAAQARGFTGGRASERDAAARSAAKSKPQMRK